MRRNKTQQEFIDLNSISRALTYLPVECYAHGPNVDTGDPFHYGGACCDGGEAALARQRAELVVIEMLNRFPKHRS